MFRHRVSDARRIRATDQAPKCGCGISSELRVAQQPSLRSDLARSDPRATAATLINAVMILTAAVVLFWMLGIGR